MTFRLGITGAIGAGKSTIARLFADLGCDVWDADATVHKLYDTGGEAVAPILALVPEARGGADDSGRICRARLRAAVLANPALLKQLEAVVHPLLRLDRAAFMGNSLAPIAVFDIPLLFETGAETEMDAVVFVRACAETRQARVMERATMSSAQLAHMSRRQLPEEQKAARADYIVVSDTPAHARAQVARIVATIKRERPDARDCP